MLVEVINTCPHCGTVDKENKPEILYSDGQCTTDPCAVCDMYIEHMVLNGDMTLEQARTQ